MTRGMAAPPPINVPVTGATSNPDYNKLLKLINSRTNIFTPSEAKNRRNIIEQQIELAGSLPANVRERVNIALKNLNSKIHHSTIYEDNPLLRRVERYLNSVKNTEESTGNAQYRILKTPQLTGARGRYGPYMDKFNWIRIKNDDRLSAAQKKTIQKIITSLQLPARDNFRNRPALNFNTTGMSIAQINFKLKSKKRSDPFFTKNKNTNTTVVGNPLYENTNVQQARQHRNVFGN